MAHIGNLFKFNSHMIPKIIHYCWFGRNPLPPLAEKCIASWKKFLPDYEIKEWNESNFDVNAILYTKEAYEAKKYAFVSDYARFKILYEEGGLYFDTDVEIIAPLDDIIERGPFMGREQLPYGATADSAVASGLGLGVNPGLGLGVNPGLGLYKELIDLYQPLHFIRKDGSQNLKTVVQYTSELLNKHGLKNNQEIQFVAGIYIYPSEYFSPKNMTSEKITITSNTRTIHHYMASWGTKRPKIQKILRKIKYMYIMPLLPIQLVQKVVSFKEKRRNRYNY